MTARRPRRGIAALAAVAATISACTLDPAKMPVPGAAVAGPTYSVHIQFTNALNLPAQAKVVANGAKVGSLRSVTIVDPSATAPGYVEAIVDISTAVRLPASTTAQLRQSTVLGDIYIGLSTPEPGPPLADGGAIGLEQTKPPLQIEDLLLGLSSFVGGGSLQQIQRIIDQANAALPEEPADTARIFDTLGRDVQDVSLNLDAVDRLLDGLRANLSAVTDNRAALDALLSPRGATEIPASANSIAQTLGIVGQLSLIANALVWLGPLLQAGDSAAKALVPLLFAANPLDLAAPSNLNRLVALLHDKVIPFAERPAIDITSVTVESSRTEQTEDMVRALRVIGLVR
ncbi:MlaD family protein [Nocardia sp. XZ_19_385]|uniref:MlaD family protein n=1 Tax=Nocardia sp. XZ_19_385 TaxID=2769488 RepID=UPI0028158FEC|nr:MlaD family protein [Nocardia sp. XZ_19_385]